MNYIYITTTLLQRKPSAQPLQKQLDTYAVYMMKHETCSGIHIKQRFEVHSILGSCHKFLPKDHLVEAHVAGGEACYAGGSVSSWQGHTSQTVQSVGARRSVVHLSSRLGVERGANNSNP
jgi:hypothetical protein